MKKGNIALKVDSAESVIDFVRNVEFENSDKISEMVKNNIDMFFDIDSTVRGIKNLSDKEDLVEDVESVICLIVELKQKLLLLGKQNYHHQKLLNAIYGDSELIYNVINENKDLIKMDNDILKNKASKIKDLCRLVIKDIESTEDKSMIYFDHYMLENALKLADEINESKLITELLLDNCQLVTIDELNSNIEGDV